MTTETERAQDFLDDYRSVFEQFDADAVAERFAYPCLIVGDGDPVDLRAVGSHAEWVEQLKMLMDIYKGFGVRTAAVLDSNAMSVTPRVIQVAIHWSLRDADDREVYDFHAVYTLVEREGALRIAAIAHDELPQIMALLSPQ
ncbi:MAG TPA: hypothetical protein VIG64_11785 [Actinomycetota bacterium]|jgi:hypothetical protein